MTVAVVSPEVRPTRMVVHGLGDDQAPGSVRTLHLLVPLHLALAHDEYLPCDVPRQSGGSTQIPSLTGYEPKLIETEAIEPEGLEPRKIELDRDIGTDPYQIQERLMRSNFQNPITEDMDE